MKKTFALSDFEHIYNYMSYELIREQMLQAFGLELSATIVHFETADEFAIPNETFGYFNPIDNSIHVNMDDNFFTSCISRNTLMTSQAELSAKILFILFHEVHHKLLLHTDRTGSRDKMLWNVAADFEVHNMLKLYADLTLEKEKTASCFTEFEFIKNMLDELDNKNFKADPENGKYEFMYSSQYLNNIAEEIYDNILNSKKIEQHQYKLDLNKMMNNSNQQQASNNKQQQDEDNTQSGNKKESDKQGNSQSSDVGNETNKQTGKSNNSQAGNTGNDGKSNSNNQANNNANDSKIDRNKVQGQAGNSMNGQAGNNSCTVTVTTTTYELPNGRKITSTNIDWPDNESLPADLKKSKDELQNQAENNELRRQMFEQNLREEAERSKGDLSASCKAFLKKLFKVKIDWEKILKTSLQTVLTKSDYFSWARPRRTTMTLDLQYLPDIVDDNNAYGKIFICVDQSGSMSDNEFQKIGNIILDAKEHYKKIVVIQHDTQINNVFEFDDINETTLKNVFTRTSCGGTSHMDVFKYIADDWSKTRFDDEEKISAVIICSDCCSDIQKAQKLLNAEVPRIYLTPAKCKEYTVGITGQIIEIE